MSVKFEDIDAAQVNSIVSDMCDVVSATVPLSDQKEDDLYEKLILVMHEFFGHPDYRNYN